MFSIITEGSASYGTNGYDGSRFQYQSEQEKDSCDSEPVSISSKAEQMSWNNAQ